MAAQLPIPVYTSLEQLYNDLGTATDHAARWNGLVKEFENRFGREPSYIARAPGRVNLIGEHIDYALFGVLPAAVERDILIACAPHTTVTAANGAVYAQNMYSKYTPQSFAPTRKLSVSGQPRDSDAQVHVEEWHLDIDKKELRWESYVKAGYYVDPFFSIHEVSYLIIFLSQGVLNRFFSASANKTDSGGPLPVDLLVTGTVPAGSGLSSSAAMVVASTLVFLAVNGKLEGVTKGSLVEMAMENEKRVGVNSGGMDQAASVMSTPASALYVTFYPRLAASPVPIPGASSVGATAANAPPCAVFVLANSLVISEKAIHARTRYNLRVVETLVAARVLARRIGLHLGHKERPTLREIVSRLGGEPEGGWTEGDIGFKHAVEKAVRAVENLKPGKVEGQEGVTMEEMIEWSGMGEKEFREVYLDWIDVEAEHFQLYKRAKHVLTEALRVLEFREICLRADTSAASGEDVLEELGVLMNQSMDSCSKMFECSCPELEQLTAIAREAGAFGSRLTGAGWGGCTVSLVAEDNVESFIAKLKAAYPLYHNLEGDAFNEVVFATKPSNGACDSEATSHGRQAGRIRSGDMTSFRVSEARFHCDEYAGSYPPSIRGQGGDLLGRNCSAAYCNLCSSISAATEVVVTETVMIERTSFDLAQASFS
ncbi:hypothetical protein EW146_g7483 [Bondarzewia mesenterica]|uniref:Galactokinase n=1 Tax=Bondarzewia mesenterica TaxID=1095465 RepID=A0A4S4LL97_9AGAM|nr:hypothetical protein EW146_g7483 [Bondarzewia mesenterica]